MQEQQAKEHPYSTSKSTNQESSSMNRNSFLPDPQTCSTHSNTLDQQREVSGNVRFYVKEQGQNGERNCTTPLRSCPGNERTKDHSQGNSPIFGDQREPVILLEKIPPKSENSKVEIASITDFLFIFARALQVGEIDTFESSQSQIRHPQALCVPEKA